MGRVAVLLLLALVVSFSLASIREVGDERRGGRARTRNSVRRRPLREQVDAAFERWKAFKTKFRKEFESVEQETEHLEAFVDNLLHIHDHNRDFRNGKTSFELAENHIADLPFSEYSKLNGYRRRFGDASEKNSTTFLAPFHTDIPDHVDWRDQGYVTPVKNQGMCGSCWAFSATGSLEGQHKRKLGSLVSLSEQNLVDCSTSYGNNGCNGGLMDFAFTYIRENKGVDTETAYPYIGQDETCHFKRKDVGADDKGFADLPEGDEEKLKIAVATQGPISIAIDAGHRSFQLYKKGVYYEPECSSEQLDHGVLLVGYGTDPEHGDYWIVKNSWGTGWGEEGYVRIARNRKNHCGVATKASYPLV